MKNKLLLLLPFVIFFLFLSLWPSSIAEDGYIILRYVRNLANGYGFVWNIGDKPVWGSTSILYTLLLAGVISVSGFSPVLAAQLTNITLACVIIGITMRVTIVETNHMFSSIAVGCFLALSTLVVHAMTGFDVLLFSLLVLVQFISLRHQHWPLFLGASSLLPMTRPEGILFAVVGTIVMVYRTRQIPRSIILLLVSLLLFYLCAFLYFGTVLPTPFFVKNKGANLEANIRRGLHYSRIIQNLIPLLFISFWSCRSSDEKTINTILATLPACIVYVAYFFVMQTQNVVYRFQFPITPIIIMVSGAGIAMFVGKEIGWKRLLIMVLIFGLIFSTEYAQTRKHTPRSYIDDNRVEVAEMLQEYAIFNYTMLTTEAGVWPYYSEWRVIDVIGLNDPRLARTFDGEYIMSQNPVIFTTAGHGLNATNVSNPHARERRLLTIALLKEHNWTKISVIPATYGEDVYTVYWTAPEWPHRAEIISRIQTIQQKITERNV